MTVDQMESRLTRIEQELEELKRALAANAGMPWWQRIRGDFKDDKAFAEILRLGRRIRRKN